MPSIKLAPIAIAVAATLVLQGCSTTGAAPTNWADESADPFGEVTPASAPVHLSNPPTIDELRSLKYSGGTFAKDESVVGDLRIRTLRETAFSLGSQAGMAWRATQIKNYHDANADFLDRIFNFSPFLIDGKILYPVILESERMFHQESDKRVRTVSVSYVLAKPARLVPSPPTWREYLSRPVIEPKLPNRNLFPKTADEVAAWQEEVSAGWEAGYEQAEEINELDQRRLERDYTGMQRFSMLVKQGVVAMPELSVGEFGVVKDGKTLNVDDVIYEITTESDFKDKKDWKPVFRP